VAAVPAGISPAVATALATQYCTAMYAVHQCPNLRSGHKALVHAAAGGVGIALTQILVSMGVEVTGTAGNNSKLELIQANGAVEGINYRTIDYAAVLSARKQKFMAVFNPVGGKSYKKDRQLIMPGGQHVLFGGSDRTSGKWGILSSLAFVQRMGLLIPIALMMKSQGITGVNMLHIADHHPELLSECLKKVSEMAEKGVLKPQIHKIYTVNEISVAHNELESRNTTGKLVVSWK
jgi:NADPH2:quinone reductase